MPFTGEQPRRRIQPDPAGTGDIHLAPGVQIGEIRLRPGGPVQGFHIGGQLHQVAGDETRRQPQVAQDLHQQPAGVPARPVAPLQCLFRALHARLEAQ